MKYKPLGARLLVDPIITTVGLEERARMSGLSIVLENENVPAPTQGRVVAVGSDPLLQEEVKVADVVFFSRYAGHEVWLEGVCYRQLEHHEVTGVLQADAKTSSEPAAPQVEHT